MKHSHTARILILILVVFALAQLSNAPLPALQKVQAVSRSIALVGSFNAWNSSSASPNPTITVMQGDTVTVSLSSIDTTHRFYVDVNGNGSPDCGTPDKCWNAFTPSTPTSYPFTVDFAPGTYTYYCSIHQSTMHGSFIVQGPPPTPDFSLSISPATQSVTAGASTTFTVTVQSLNSFAGAVTVASSIAPNNPSISTNPTSVSLSAGGSGTSTVTVTTSSSSGLYSSPTPNGSYSVTVTGTSGTTSHSKTATVSVGPQGSTNPANNSIDPLLLGGIVGAILIAIIAGVGVYILRRRPKK